jgi:putative RecB family exonuclease
VIALATPPRQPARQIPEDDHLTKIVSASRLNCFHSCRLKFFFRYVQELSKPTTAALYVGKVVHAALQQWSTARWRGSLTMRRPSKAGSS